MSAGNDPAWDRGWGQCSSEKPPPEAKEIIFKGALSETNQTPVPVFFPYHVARDEYLSWFIVYSPNMY